MLEIVYSPRWKALSDYAGAQIAADAGQGLAGRVLIVPEQYSFETERALCALGGDTVSRFAEVLSFSRLAERACAVCGGIARKAMDQGGRIMALARTVDQVRSKLRYYARSAQRADFLTQMLSMVDELKSYRVDSRQLHAAAERLDGTLAVKTQELALLLEGYETVCASGMPDPRDRLELLLEHITHRGFGKDLRVFVDGFFGFTAQELQILSALIAQGTSVTVCLCCDDPFRGEQIFSGVRRTAGELMREADRCGATVRCTPIVTEPTPLEAVALSAFTRADAPACAGLRLYESPNPREEVESICADILAHVRTGGRYRDVTVACADPEQLRPILETAFERCEIPAFFAGKTPALRTALLSAVLCAMRAASGRMEREDVIAYLRSDGAGATQEECDRLENYALLWNISGEQWRGEWILHPRGIGQELREQDRQLLDYLNALRVRCLTPLTDLYGALRECRTVGDHVGAVYDFLCKTEFSRCVSERLAEQGDDPQTAQVTRQLYELLINALEQLYSVQFDVRCTSEEFVRLMEILLSQYQVGAIPAVLDAVTVGQTNSFAHRRTGMMFVCGCTDGNFPAVSVGGGLLTEAERRRLSAVGVLLAPDEYEQMDRALISTYALLSAADDTLCISASGQAAWLFETLCSLYPDLVRAGSDAPSTAFANAKTLGLWLACHPGAVTESESAAGYCQALQSAAAYDFGVLTPRSVRGLYGQTLSLSASRIDRYATCRFHFFLYDGLKAAERRQAAFDAPVYGSFVHSVLERTVRQVMDEGGFHVVDDARIMQIARRNMDAYLQELTGPFMRDSNRFSYLMQRNYDEVLEVVAVLSDELRQSAFEPADCELTFGNGKTLPPVIFGAPEGDCALSGAVDRVDLAQIGGHTFFRVVDYKTGGKDLDFTELLERRGLQMLIYLFALEQSGYYGSSIHPAGVLYVPAHDKIRRLDQRPDSADSLIVERNKQRRRAGLLLDDPLLLEAMEPGQDAKRVLLPNRPADRMNPGQLLMLRRYVSDALSDMTGEIFRGDVRPNPYVRGDTGSCTYCPYASVCHLDLSGIQPKSLQGTKAEEFWQRLERREARNG